MEWPLRTDRRRAMLAAMLLTLAGLLVVALTAGDYGVAWDDWVQTRYGELVLDYFLTGGQNRACNDYLDLRFYAPAFELPSAIVCRWFPHAVAPTRHVLCALVSLSSIPALYLLAALIGRIPDG